MMSLRKMGCPKDCRFRASNMNDVFEVPIDDEDDACWCNFAEHPCGLVSKNMAEEMEKSRERYKILEELRKCGR